MSLINNNGLTPGFGSPSGLPNFSFGNLPTAAPGGPQPASADNIEFAPYQPAQQTNATDFGDSATPGTSGLGSLYNQLLGSLSSMFSNLGSMFGYSATSGSAPGQPAPQLNGRDQTYFTSASASSVGDPHESLSGTTGGGSTIDQKWNSMVSHPNLLDSDSFAGGYRVSTAVTTPNASANGVTQNQSATVTTSGGGTSVTMNQDGSYAVTSYGRSLTLPTGQPQNLGNGETVTLNADKSLTISDTNASGGCITTTLKPNGTGGVDVTNEAKNVDLGGSLVGHAEYRANKPGDGSPPNATPYEALASPTPGALGFTSPYATTPAQLADTNDNFMFT
jgi:hypothetical protein